jgi:hypothetical protein
MTIEEALHQDVRELRAEVEARRANEALLAASLKRLDADLAVVCARESQALDEYAKHRRVLEAEVERLRDSTTAVFVKTLQGCLAEAEADRDRLRAVLAHPPSFGQAWAAKEAQGYQYGGAALEHVEHGWDMAIAALRARALEGAP